ncbi:MAG: 50S ribosome-binding GTPase [Planctomycetes bacterium]|nr:50S ribosome-binding GTPase [Planctomycetota bacterium]
MRRLKTWWLLVLGLLVLPHVLLSVAGALWLVEHRWLFYWLASGGMLTLAGWGLARWLRTKKPPPMGPAVKPALTWPPTGLAAWDDVESIARRAETEDLPLDRPELFGALLVEVLEAVARHYHPKATRAALEIPAPYVLRVVELVACDLRKAFSEYLPWSHVLTLGDFVRVKRLAAWAKELFFLYRIARLGFDPVAALLREIRQMATGGLQDTSASGVKRWAVGFCVRKAGYYAIQLYGGHLVLDDVAFDAYRPPQSKRDAESAQASHREIDQEPLRILVFGQVKSGKSSLINALFGEVRAAVDVVPRTRGVEPFVVQRDDIPRAIILDSAGYENVEGAENPFAELREQILDCDLLVLVCSARSAARSADRRLLDQLGGFFQQEPNRMMPPLVVTLSHVDQLRPLAEWDPPYDLAEPSGAKAEQIRDAVQAVREDLALGAEQVVVPVCLKSGQVYNVEEGLAPVILQLSSEAERMKFLRCLRHFHDDEHWRRLWQQAVNSGRVLLSAGAAWTRRPAR